MSCEYNYKGDWYTEEDLQKIVEGEREKIVLNDPELQQDSGVQADYTKTIQLKKNLIYSLNERDKALKRKRKELDHDVEYVKEVTRQLNQNEEIRLELEEEVAALEKATSLDVLDFYAERDFQRLSSFAESTNEQDLAEAKRIISFYKAVGTFDINGDHPLFERESLWDKKGRLILPEGLRSKLESYASFAQDYSNMISGNERVKAMELINEKSGLAPKTYEEVFYTSEGLKDINLVDMFVMDTTNGIFSHNGIVPQIKMKILNDAMEDKLVSARSIEERVDNLSPKVSKILSTIDGGKYNLNAKGILGTEGVSWDLFRAKDSDGKFKDTIIQRYASKYFESRNAMLRETNRLRSKAIKAEKSEDKDKAYAELERVRREWYKDNTIMLDPSRLSSIRQSEDFKEFNKNFVEDQEYENNLKKILGEQGFNEEVKKQKKLLKQYQVDKQVFKDNILDQYNVSSISELPSEGMLEYKKWEQLHDPFTFYEAYEKNEPVKLGKKSANSSMSYNYAIPKKEINGKDSGFYDNDFKQIEEIPELKEFHNLLTETMETIYDNIPENRKKYFNAYSIPALEKNVAELITTNSLIDGLSKSGTKSWDNIKGMFGINAQDTYSYTKVDPITGKPEYRINDSFLKSNKEEIDKRLNTEMLAFKAAMGMPPSQSLGLDDYYPRTAISPKAKQILMDASGMTEDQIFQEDQVSPRAFLKAAITDQVVQNNSFDLPKIMKLFSFLSMEYAAREEVMPTINMLKTHYQDIKTPSLNNVGENIINSDGTSRFEGLRKNANKQLDSWFERAVLGDYESKNEFSDSRIKNMIKIPVTGNEYVDNFMNKIKEVSSAKILSKDDKEFKSKLEKIQKDLESKSYEKGSVEEKSRLRALDNISKQKDKLGKEFAASKVFDAIFNFIRFKGLGWNISSGITNQLEGFQANQIAGASGQYFSPENLHRANNIVLGSFLKNVAFLPGMKTSGAVKTRILMDRYRILQDASNELQKASAKTAFSKLKKFEPYEITRRAEYVNQAPIMISKLLDIQIKGKNGETSNVWDALNDEGKLKENFATEENVSNWELSKGQEYKNFSSETNKAIVNIHGDYDQLRGNMSKSYTTGKALLMFKGWMARNFYTRFGTKQADIEAGISEYKGRYKSHIAGSGAIHGAALGFAGLSILGAGPLGLLIGGTIGGTIGKLYGANSQLSILKEMSIVGKEMALSMLRIPVNTLTGKQTIRNIKLGSLENTMTDLDIANLKANVVDMAMLLAFTGMLLFTKALLWDDDDEESDVRRKAHNMLANRFMQLSGQASQYLNPVETFNSTVGNIALVRFFEDVGKTMVEAQDALEGRDIIQGGPNSGESALYNQMEKTFFPGILKSEIGFESQMQRQFQPSPFDSWFLGSEEKAKKAVRGMRAEYRKELEDQGYMEKDVNQMLNKKFPPKRKGETYEEMLGRVG